MVAVDDDEDEDERTQQRGSAFAAPRPVTATFHGKRLEPIALPRADARAMAAMKSLEVRTPELALEPQALLPHVRPPAQTIEEETAPTMPIVPDADVQITVAIADDEPDTITKRDALSDQDIITTPNALSEPDSITPQATTNMLELLKRVAQPSVIDEQEPPRPPAHTIPLVHEAPDRTLPFPKGARVREETVRIPKEEARQIGEAMHESIEPAPLPPPSVKDEPKPVAKRKRSRWPIMLLVLLLAGVAIAVSQSELARARVSEAISRIRQ